MNSRAIVVLTSVAERADAERIAAALVAKRLAACVKVSGPVESTYRWQGKIESAQEWQCAIKTLAARYPDVEAAIRELHSYDEPEILAIPILQGSASYLEWIEESLTGDP